MYRRPRQKQRPFFSLQNILFIWTNIFSYGIDLFRTKATEDELFKLNVGHGTYYEKIFSVQKLREDELFKLNVGHGTYCEKTSRTDPFWTTFFLKPISK